MVPTRNSDTRGKDPGTHEKDSGIRNRDFVTRGNDPRIHGRRGIPQIRIQPAIPYKLSFRHGSNKNFKMKDIDQEKLRAQLIEEAKQRKTLSQAVTVYSPALGQYKALHHEAIILSSEKMSPAKDGSIAHLGSVNILPGQQRVSSFSGIIEEAGEIEPSPLTGTTNASTLHATHPSPIDSSTIQLDQLDKTISNHIKEIHNHIGRAKDSLVLHVKAKNAASACLVKTRCDSIEALGNGHNEETSKKLEMLSGEVKLIRNETADMAAGLESVTDFAGKIHDITAAGLESLEQKVATMDKKLDTMGRAVSTMDRRLITAKDDFNELNFKVGEIKESSMALRADHKSLLEKYNILMEQSEAGAERREELSDGLKSVQREFRILQDNQTALINKMKEFLESIAPLQADNERLRLENQKLRESNGNTVPETDFSNTLHSLVQRLDARESRINQIFNMLSGTQQHTLLPTPPDSAINMQFSPTNAMTHAPASAAHPAQAPTLPATQASMFNQHPTAASTWYHHANAIFQG
ncbi:hypothetical protein FGG08_006168 [Glutinoglossum americanum]|uniref:Uncharacterized protein n=1 Tax=Glutinoglossum americanum TaxID=1670608 RepID=A0A9P8I228_9PEZI|nr:hypothetical protein FGG08_006168 [Glutinoglossum americanum]